MKALLKLIILAEVHYKMIGLEAGDRAEGRSPVERLLGG